MPFVDLIIWFLGIYGISWTIVYSKILDYPRDKFFNYYLKTQRFKFFYDLLSCIVCTSFWVASSCVWFYFPHEIAVTKLLAVFSAMSFTSLIHFWMDDDY